MVEQLISTLLGVLRMTQGARMKPERYVRPPTRAV